jgi:hypothetical protein
MLSWTGASIRIDTHMLSKMDKQGHVEAEGRAAGAAVFLI